MALAPFFDRARQSAAQALRDFDAEAFERRLGGIVVTLAFDTQAARSFEGLASLDMAARLTARLYPRVAVLALDGDGALADELLDIMRSINPEVEVVEGFDPGRVFVVVGSTPLPPTDATAVYVGSDRWIARVSSRRPVGSGTGVVPFGAGAAACIAMANVFRSVFADWMERPDLDEEVALSLLDFTVGVKGANGDLPSGTDVGLVQLVGVGAIGNAFVWSMSRLNDVSGTMHLIDPEKVDLGNLQRYVLPSNADVDRSKVALGMEFIDKGGLRSQAFSASWAEYVGGMGHHVFDTVAVALDTVRGRLQVQSSLPRRIVNAWTQAGDLGLSRHGFVSEEACLACLYLPQGPRRNEDEIVLAELGLPVDRLMDVRTMLHLGIPVDEPFVRQIAQALSIDPTVLLPFVGLPLRAFRQKAICGNALVRAPDGGGAEIEVPMAFQSALAGVMLAAEIVADASGLRTSPPATRTVLDLMRSVPERISFPMLKNTAGAARCICGDADHIDVYRAKYG